MSFRKRLGAWNKLLFELVFMVVTVIFFLGGGKSWVLSRPAGIGGDSGQDELQPLDPSGRLNVLCLGIDSVEGTHRTDSILLIGVVPADNKITILSIPRDTRVITSGRARKINEIYARSGERELRHLIEDLLQIRVHRTVAADFGGFIKLMDTIGGIDINIDRPMHYDDNFGNLHIHFDKGPTHLDGKKALEFVRYRGDPTADLGRIKRQRDFVAAVIKKVLTPAVALKLPLLIEQSMQHVTADLSAAEVIDLALALRIGNLTIQSISLPGEARYVDKVSFFLPYQDQATAIGARDFAELSLLEMEAGFSLPSAVERLPAASSSISDVSTTDGAIIPETHTENGLTPFPANTGSAAVSPAQLWETR